MTAVDHGGGWLKLKDPLDSALQDRRGPGGSAWKEGRSPLHRARQLADGRGDSTVGASDQVSSPPFVVKLRRSARDPAAHGCRFRPTGNSSPLFSPRGEAKCVRDHRSRIGERVGGTTFTYPRCRGFFVEKTGTAEPI